MYFCLFFFLDSNKMNRDYNYASESSSYDQHYANYSLNQEEYNKFNSIGYDERENR